MLVFFHPDSIRYYRAFNRDNRYNQWILLLILMILYCRSKELLLNATVYACYNNKLYIHYVFCVNNLKYIFITKFNWPSEEVRPVPCKYEDYDVDGWGYFEPSELAQFMEVRSRDRGNKKVFDLLDQNSEYTISTINPIVVNR